MLIFQIILAGTAVCGAATGRTAVVAGAGLLGVALGAPLRPALAAAAPLVVFLTAALTLAATAETVGLADRAADALARLGRGRGVALYALVCATCALLTVAVSLDGAVVLMVPLLIALRDRHGAPLGPLLLGMVVVANAASVAVPQGNPTNLVLIERLGISPSQFAAHMALPGLAAAVACALVAGGLERRTVARRYSPAHDRHGPQTPAERRIGGALVLAALSGCAAPLAGVPTWWSLPPVALLALLVHPRPRPRLRVPARLALQLTSLLVLIVWLGKLPAPAPGGVLALIALALATGAAAALANNLPVSVSAGSLLAAGASGYAATIGLGVGALATRQGSVATLIAADLAGPAGDGLTARRLAAPALAGVLSATLVFAATA
jgi:arsenical pump membrane protein